MADPHTARRDLIDAFLEDNELFWVYVRVASCALMDFQEAEGVTSQYIMDQLFEDTPSEVLGGPHQDNRLTAVERLLEDSHLDA